MENQGIPEQKGATSTMTFHDQGQEPHVHQSEILMPLEKAAQILDIPEEELRRQAGEGRLGCVKKNGDYWFSEKQIGRIHHDKASQDSDLVTPALELILLEPGHRKNNENSGNENNPWKKAFAKIIFQFRSLKQKNPLSHLKWKEWMEQFFQLVERKKQKDVHQEQELRQVSVKLGFMTGKNELYCDFCEVNDHFYPGAIFADVYVDGALKWMMCPNCLQYCREQANGSMESNLRARFHQLAFRLERESRRARNLATTEDFRVPSLYEWEAWENASFAMQEVAASFGEEAAMNERRQEP